MKKIHLLLFLFIASNVLIAHAQQLHCGTSEKMEEQLALNPDLRAARTQIESFTQRWIEENEASAERAVVTIPVVVHVVYKTSIQNISDDQIISQIEVLNEDYRAQNTDVTGVPSVWTNRVADSEIEFALATCDPNGYHTNGITRTETTVSNWGGSDNVKYTSQEGHDAWPASDYLNIWVCNIGGGLLGYAYQPGINPAIDGVVIGYNYFGREGTLSNTYDGGRTATHEIGHYFNLDHLWGTGASNTNCTANDAVSDTPKQQEPNYGCNTTYPHETCGVGVNSDMFNNYMDYGNDECLFFFTNGQKSRMLAALNGPRAGLKTSSGLSQCPVGIEEQRMQSSLQIYPNPATDIVNIQSDQINNMNSTIRIIDLSGRVVMSRSNLNIGHAATAFDISELSVGTYVLEVRNEIGTVSKKINILQ